MKVSVVTISYNQAEFLEACIRSVLSQGPNVEYIVIDGGSTDGSVEILESYREQIAHLVIGADSGPADALNRGFRLATGDILGYLNSDDVYLPGAVERTTQLFQDASGIDVLYGDISLINQSGEWIARMSSAPWNLVGVACAGLHVMQPATFFRREAYERAGGFNAQNPSCWDRELLVDLALTGSTFRHVPEVLAGHRVYLGSITGSGRLRTLNHQQHLRIFEKVLRRPLRALDHIRRDMYRVGWRLRSPAKIREDVRWFIHPDGRWRRLFRSGRLGPIAEDRTTESAGVKSTSQV